MRGENPVFTPVINIFYDQYSTKDSINIIQTSL